MFFGFPYLLGAVSGFSKVAFSASKPNEYRTWFAQPSCLHCYRYHPFSFMDGLFSLFLIVVFEQTGTFLGMQARMEPSILLWLSL